MSRVCCHGNTLTSGIDGVRYVLEPKAQSGGVDRVPIYGAL